MPKILDANTIVRYLTNDDSKKSKRVEKLLNTSPDLSLRLLDMVCAEIVWVLTKFYKFNKKDVMEKMQIVIGMSCILANKERLFLSLQASSKHNIDFIDAYIAIIAEENKEDVCSFDRDFDKIKSVKRLEP